MTVSTSANASESTHEAQLSSSAHKWVPTLENQVPEADAARLRRLHAAANENPRDVVARHDLDLLCAQLVRRGYTLKAIGALLGVTGEAIRRRAIRVPDAELVGIEAEVSKKKPLPPAQPVQPRPSLTDSEVVRLQELQPLARQKRGRTTAGSDVAVAADEYNQILLVAHERGATAYTMAKQLGYTTAAVKFRLDRLLGTLPPSMQPSGKLDPLAGLDDELLTLMELADLAEILPGRGPNNPERLEASRQFNQLLAQLDSREIPLSSLARVLGRTRAGLAYRLEQYRRGTPAEGSVERDESAADLKSDEPATTGSTASHPFQKLIDTAKDANEADVSVVGRAGWLTDFAPEETPVAPSEPVPGAWIDPQARDEATARHHDAVRRLRAAARTAGHKTTVWDLGQDVAFLARNVLVNVEVKTVGDEMSQQLRLGVGQLLEQLEHHREHMAEQATWYVDAEVDSLAGVLVLVGPTEIPPVWRRLAQRAKFAIWTLETAEQEFGRQSPSVPAL